MALVLSWLDLSLLRLWFLWLVYSWVHGRCCKSPMLGEEENTPSTLGQIHIYLSNITGPVRYTT